MNDKETNTDEHIEAKIQSIDNNILEHKTNNISSLRKFKKFIIKYYVWFYFVGGMGIIYSVFTGTLKK